MTMVPFAALVALAFLACSVSADAPNNPPSIAGLPDQTVLVGQAIPLLDLHLYASDSEDPDVDMAFAIDYQSNTAAINCYVTGNRYVGCSAAQNAGYSDITVRVTDTGDLYAIDAFRITVIQAPLGEVAPVISSISITPSNPVDSDDLTCNVDFYDENSNLDRVQFKWFVEGALEKTRTVYVHGSSGSEHDTLGSSRSGLNDDVKCEARVYDQADNHDFESETVTIGRHECGVDVYGLEILDNNKIRFRIRNTGSDEETITYKIYADGEQITEDDVTLDSDDWDSVQKNFDFGTGDYTIKVRAIADCGESDSEIILHDVLGDCQAKYMEEYRCSGNWVQRKYQYSDCSTAWVNSEYCSSGCSGGACIGAAGQCGVAIQNFNYQASVVAGNAAFASVEAKNTGAIQQAINISLWVDGLLRDSYSSSVNPNSIATRAFYYYPSAGSHQIILKAEAGCGSSDTRTAFVTVSQSGAPVQPQPQLPTAVSIYPSSVEASLCEAKFVKIDVHNAVEQVYTIEVTGIPEEWVSYQSQNIVGSGERQLYVYVGPKEIGVQSMNIKVRAETEKKDFEQDVYIYTAPCSDSGTGGDGITGSLIEAANSPLFWVALIFVGGGVVLLIGVSRLRPDEEFYEPEYPYRVFRKR
jgi:hypothetical protein